MITPFSEKSAISVGTGVWATEFETELIVAVDTQELELWQNNGTLCDLVSNEHGSVSWKKYA